MQRRNAKFLASLAMVSTAALALFSGLASASRTSTSSNVHVYEADENDAGNRGTVILTGAITDYGTDHQGEGPNGSNRLTLQKGSFAVDVSKLGTKLHNLPVDPMTCSADGTVSGQVPIIPGSGTGAYAGISGTLGVKASEASILPRKDGQCDTNASWFPGVLIVRGSGTVSYRKTN